MESAAWKIQKTIQKEDFSCPIDLPATKLMSLNSRLVDQNRRRFPARFIYRAIY